MSMITQTNTIAPPGFWPQAVAAGATMIMITRDHDFYFYSRKGGGITAPLGERISRARAQEIVQDEANAHGRIIGHSPVDWTPGAKQWTWVCEVGNGD